MYSEYYGLSGLPFQLTPDPRFFFGSSGHNRAMAHLTYGLHQAEGFIVVTGDVGAGKTTLIDVLMDQLDHSSFVAAKIVTTHLNADDMLRMVASAFGVGHEGLDKAALIRRLETFFELRWRECQRCLLIVDEVQNVPVGGLEELRMLSNLTSGSAPLQSFLLGQPQFRSTLAAPNLEQLRQRVTASFHLSSMSSSETSEYVLHRLRTVGWRNDPLFTGEALAAVHRHSGGVPRRINTLCSRILLFGFLEGLHQIDLATVDQVAEDLFQELGATASAPIVSAQPPAEAAPGALPAGVESRLAALEASVNKHEKAIKQVIDMAARYLQSLK